MDGSRAAASRSALRPSDGSRPSTVRADSSSSAARSSARGSTFSSTACTSGAELGPSRQVGHRRH